MLAQKRMGEVNPKCEFDAWKRFEPHYSNRDFLGLPKTTSG